MELRSRILCLIFPFATLLIILPYLREVLRGQVHEFLLRQQKSHQD